MKNFYVNFDYENRFNKVFLSAMPFFRKLLLFLNKREDQSLYLINLDDYKEFEKDAALKNCSRENVLAARHIIEVCCDKISLKLDNSKLTDANLNDGELYSMIDNLLNDKFSDKMLIELVYFFLCFISVFRVENKNILKLTSKIKEVRHFLLSKLDDSSFSYARKDIRINFLVFWDKKFIALIFLLLGLIVFYIIFNMHVTEAFHHLYSKMQLVV